MNNPKLSRERQLSNVFVALADSLVTGYDVVDLMQQLITTCVELLNSDAAGLLLVDREGYLRVMASSSEKMQMLELFEIQNAEGPCLDCFAQGAPLGPIKLADAYERWPRFAPTARAAGFESAQALPLRLRDQTLGAMNLFFADNRAMSEDDTALAQALADVATIGLLQQRAVQERDVLTDQLQRALTNRLIIEQAKGVIAERGGLTVDEAFVRLRDYSRHHRLAISDVAGRIVRSEFDPSAIVSHR